MKKSKLLQSKLSNHFFAVWPISLRFLTPFSGKINLYFEKQMQILCNHQVRPSKPQTQYLFDQPTSIDYFRIIFNKLGYRWSLYQQFIKDQSVFEEYLENQNIVIQISPEELDHKKTMIEQREIIFNRVQSTFRFLIIAAEDYKSILKIVQKYYSEKRSLQILQPQQSILGQSIIFSALNPQFLKEKKCSNNSLLNQTIKSETSPIIIDQQFNRQNLRSKQLTTPKKIHKFTAQSQIKDVGIRQLQHQIYSTPKEGLTLSEIQISLEIEKQINLPKEPLKNDLIKKKQYKRKATSKQIQLSSSQILNQNGSIVISPFYKFPKYYAIIAAIICIFYILIIFSPKERLASIKRRNKSKAKIGKQKSQFQ